MSNDSLQESLTAFSAQETEFKARTLRDNWTQTAGTTPDEFAKQIALSRATQIPIQSLYADPEEAKRHQVLAGTDFTGLVSGNPHTTNFFLDQKNAGIARDLVPNLTAMENAWGTIKDTGIDLGKSVIGLGESAVGMADIAMVANPLRWALAATDVAGMEATRPGALLAAIGYNPNRLKNDISAGYSLPRQAAAANVQAAKGFWNTAGALLDNPRTILGGVAESSLLTLSGAGAVRAAAVKALSVASAEAVAAGLSWTAADATALLSSPAMIAKLSAIGGFSEGAMTAGQIQEDARQAGRNFGQSIGPALVGGATTGLISVLTSRILPDAEVRAAVASLVKTTTAGNALSFGKGLAKTMTKEGVLEENLQSYQEHIWGNIAQGKPWDQGAAEAAAQGMVIGAVQGGGTHMYSSTVEHITGVLQSEADKVTAKVDTNAAAMTAIFKEATALGQRSPDDLKGFLHQVTDGRSVLIDPATLTEVLAKAGVDLAAKLPTAAAEIAKGDLGDIEVPIAELVAGLTGTGVEAELIPHLRLDPDLPTQAEDRADEGKAAAFLQKKAALVMEEQSRNAEFLAHAQEVHDDVLGQLNAVGKHSAQANAGYAKLAQHFYVTAASDWGVTPKQIRDGWTDAKGVVHPGYQLKIGDERVLPSSAQLDQTLREGRIRHTIAELVTAAESQSDWRTWYTRHENTITDLFGTDAELFQKILSATSQATGVKGNVTLALKAYDQLLSGEDFTGYLPAVIKNLERIKADTALVGAKIAQYGEANEGNTEAIAVDRHIAMLFFNTKTPSAKQIDAAKTRIRAVAARLGWEPRQVQAALWAYNQVRLGTDPTKVESYDKILEARADFIAALRTRHQRGEGGSLSTGGGTVPGSTEGTGDGQFNQQPGGAAKLGLAEFGDFKTGSPVTFEFIRRTEKSPKPGAVDTYAQKVEPAGRYVSVKDHSLTIDGTESGSITFQSPLVIEYGAGLYTDSTNWKHKLSAAYGGKTGKALSKALLADGYDGVVTVKPDHVSEVVDLSVIGSPTVKGLFFQADTWHYSQLARAVEQAPDKVFGKATAVKDWLLANAGKLGVKQAELEATGVTDWLDTQAKVTKEDIAAFLEQGGVQVQEVMLGEDPIGKLQVRLDEINARYSAIVDEHGVPVQDLPPKAKVEIDALTVEHDALADRISGMHPSDNAPKFAKYQLPGDRKDYRELLLALPPTINKLEQWKVIRPNGHVDSTYASEESARIQARQRGEGYTVQQGAPKELEGGFRSSHFDQPNILAHIRFSERVDVNKKRVLFIEEIQSDWGQKGKKVGFGPGPGMEAYTASGERIHVPGKVRVPAAPFVTDTKAWTALAFKRMLAYAVEQGFDRVAWTTGAQQAERYDLSKSIGQVAYRPDTQRLTAYDLTDKKVLDETVAPKDLADYIGKEAADKLLAARVDTFGEQELSGLDLKVGGEGMKGFYDAIVPQVANDVLKKLGAGKVGTTEIQGEYTRDANNIPSLYKEWHTQPSFDITPELADVVRKGLPLFQDKDAPLGSFNPKTLDLRLLAGANYSTFLHELGHFFLTAYADMASQPGAPQRVVDNMNALLKEFGIADLATWNNMTLDQQRPYHERFAEAMEQYYLTGKAPSLALQPLFERFTSWLKKVYGSLKEFVAGHPGAQLNPELAAVMDRMLATDAEIEAANAARNYVQMFKDAAEAGMTDKQFADYTALDTAQQEDANAMLRSRSMRDMKWLQNRRNKIIAGLQADAKEKRDAMRAEVAAEVAATPLRRAMAYLKRGTLINAEGADVTPLGPNKLQISEVKDMFPEGALVAPPDYRKLGYGAYGMLAEVGLSPDYVAEQFGFKSGEEMVRQILEAPRFNDEVEGRTDDRMLETYGDLNSQQAISRAADEAIHNSAHIKMVATELAHLAANIGSPLVLVKAAKEYARQILETKTSRTIKPWFFAAAETRASKAALAFLKQGKRDEAANEKRTELVNAALAKEAYATEKEVKAIIDGFRKLTGYNDEASAVKSRDHALVNAVRVILFAHGLGGQQRTKSAVEYLKVVEENDPGLAATVAPLITEATASVKAKGWRDLTVAELRDLKEDVDGIWFLAKRTRQSEIDGKMVAQRDIQDQLVTALETKGIPLGDLGAKHAVTEADERSMLFDTAKAVLRRMEFWVEGMDSYAVLGPFARYIFHTIKDAENAYNLAKASTLEKYLALLDTVRPTLGRRMLAAKPENGEIDYTFGHDNGGSGKAELLHAILHLGNDSNKRKLLLGRGWAEQREDGSMDTSKWDKFIARMHDEGIVTKQDYDFAQGVWDLMDSMKPAAQKAHRAVFGKFFATVTANALDTPFGVYAGGYVPAMTDTRIVTDADMHKLQEAENENMTLAFPAPAKGFTKGRVEYNRELLLDLRSLGGHIDKVLLFSHMAVPVNDVRRVLTNKDVSVPLNKVAPKAMMHLIHPWLNRAAKQMAELKSPEYGKLGRFWSKSRGNVGMSVMMGHIANAAQQVTGVLSAALNVDAKYLVGALGQGILAPVENGAHVREKSAYMRGRLDNEVAAMSDNINEILLNPSVYASTQQWTRRHAYFLQSTVDSILSPIIWTAAYNQALDKHPGMPEADAVKIADGEVRKSQGATGPTDIASFEAGHAFFRMFTQFAGYANGQSQLIGNAWGRNMARDMGLPAKYGRAAFVVGIGFLAPAIVGELIMQLFRGGPDDDNKDGKLLDDWLAQLFFWAPVKYATSMVPGVGQVAKAGITAWNGKPYDDRIGTAPTISAIEAGTKFGPDAYKAVMGQGAPGAAIKDAASLIGLFTGLPTGMAARPVSYLADVAAGKVKPTDPADVIRGTITGTASPGSKVK